jgi:hypothetical protein
MSLLTQFYPGPGGGGSTTVVGSPAEISGAAPQIASDSGFLFTNGGSWPSIAAPNAVLSTGTAGRQGDIPSGATFWAGNPATVAGYYTQPSDLYWINTTNRSAPGAVTFHNFKTVNNIQVFTGLSNQSYLIDGKTSLEVLNGFVGVKWSSGLASLTIKSTKLTDITGLSLRLVGGDSSQRYHIGVSNATLTQASVDHLVACCLATGTVTSSTINTSGGTSAAISAADAAALVANGWTVTSN